ncbi:Vacuolar membrane amino acid uptake transporter fnx2, partial [Colletotrichum sp. SAR 10_86]
MTGLPNGASAPTETSPLLRSTDPESVNGNGNGAIQNGGAGRDDKRDGKPEMAKKMHLLLPAIGIGIYLCAVDQLLTVATYAKIGSELHALNNTSWLATA